MYYKKIGYLLNVAEYETSRTAEEPNTYVYNGEDVQKLRIKLSFHLHKGPYQRNREIIDTDCKRWNEGAQYCWRTKLKLN